jgi:hypothetical protein
MTRAARGLCALWLASILLAGCGLFGTESGNPAGDRGQASNLPPGSASGSAGSGAFGNPGAPRAGTGASVAGAGAAGMGGMTPVTSGPCALADGGPVTLASCPPDAGVALDASIMDEDGGLDDDAAANAQ